MMRPVVTCTLGALIVAPLPGATAQPTSWGKPGVSIEQYRRDAVECGRGGYYLDVSHTEAAGVFKRATRELENNEADMSLISMDGSPSAPRRLQDIVARSAHIVEGTRPDARFKQVGSLMQGTVDDCLRGRGYVRFRLTDAQRNRLRHLHLGSPQRHAYLFGLASDPAIVAAQAI